MPRVAAALLLTLVASFSAGAAGHDVSTVRYAPSGYTVGPAEAIGFNGSRFLTVWAMAGHGYGSLTDPATGISSGPFLLPGVSGSPAQMIRWGDGFMSLWWSVDHLDIVTLTANGGVERVARIGRSSWTPRVATNGRQLLIVDNVNNVDTNWTSTIYASLYEPDGTLLTRTALPAAAVSGIDAARAGGAYAIATAGQFGVRFFRLDDGGTITADVELQGPSQPWRAMQIALAGDAAHAVVAWTMFNSTIGYTTSVGSRNDVAPLQSLPVKDARIGIRIVPTASGYLMLWNDNNQVAGVRANTAGQILDTAEIPIMAGILGDAAAGDDHFAVVTAAVPFSYSSPAALSVLIGAVQPQGLNTSLADFPTTTAARQEQPVIASDGVDYVAAWLEHDGTDVIAMIGRVTRSGTPLDGPGVALPVPGKSIWNVSIARGPGSDALVVVSAPQGLFAFRWSSRAGLLDASPIVLAAFGAPYGTAVAWNGSRYLVVWSGGSSSSLTGRFIGSDGALSAAIAIPMATAAFAGEPRGTAIAWDGQQFLVASGIAPAFICNLSACPTIPAEEVRLARAAADGSLLDAAPYRILDSTSARIATSGSEFLVALTSPGGITTVVVHGAATGLSVSAPAMTIPDGGSFDVTWDGANYDIAWTGFGDWLRLTYLNRSGDVLQTRFTTASVTGVPSAAANGAGDVAIGIAEEAPPSGLTRARMYASSELQPAPPPPAAPTYAISHLAGHNALLQWDGNAPGFLVEMLFHPNVWGPVQRVKGDVHEATVYANPGYFFRIRAYGPGGTSPDGAITSVGSDHRARAVRR